MKIGMQTWGSHGDIRPLVALAEGLQDAGHDVTLAITCVDSDHYRDLDSIAGVRTRLIASPVIPDKALLAQASQAILRERNPIRQTQMAIERLFLPAESAMFEASEQLCAENDLVIGHFFHYPLGAAAARYGRPYASVVLNHGAIPSAFKPPAGVPDLGTFGNRLAWRLARSVLNSRLRKYSDRLRARHGIVAAGDLIDTVWASEQLTLVAISRTICARQPDWPDCYQVCGTLDARDGPLEGDIPQELQAFLSAGAAPVYLTFGSMMQGGGEGDTLAMLTEAARMSSMRAIIQAPHWEASGFRSSDSIHYTRSAPHAAVFPQCRLIVHHGGAGTSQSALLAGKPSLVVAHTAEQQLWGRELERIGAAPAWIPRRQATPHRISDAIRSVAGSGAFSERSRRLGLDMAAENGVSTAVGLINHRFAT